MIPEPGEGFVRLSPLKLLLDPVKAVAQAVVPLVIALVAHYTVRHAVTRWSAWIFFGLTVISTLYFGWHYIADDISGVLISFIAVYIGGLATGQKFDRGGRLCSRPARSHRIEIPAGGIRAPPRRNARGVYDTGWAKTGWVAAGEACGRCVRERAR